MNRIAIISISMSLASVCVAQDTNKVADAADVSISKSVEQIVLDSRPSIVVVTTEGRDGDESGLGTGFVIDDGGLIATNFHVIGEARPIWIQTHDGERIEVTEVFASDRALDLAIVRVDPNKNLKPLSLADESFAQGQPAIAIGHPLGLKNTVVNGIIAGERDFDGVPMWQAAMTIEPGNSGGPLLDMHGRVHGVITMKSTGPESFGFAVKIAELKKLIAKPNPISIERWKTIGQLDAKKWQATMGARWRQRSGRILVSEPGDGFGGRSLLLHAVAKKPTIPFELAVSVKLDDEAGAAGLTFHSDGDAKHYGFYPSAGRMRLTSFEGPTVFSWNVLREFQTDHYRQGEWNEIKVRVEKDKIVGFVNGHEVVTVDSVRQPPGQIGLCKFRQTKAEFKNFRFGEKVDSMRLAAEEIISLEEELEQLPARSALMSEDLESHATNVEQRLALLERKARALENEAAEIRKLGQDIHVAAICRELSKSVSSADGEVDMLAGALLIAKLDNPELDVQTYMDAVNAMADEIRSEFKPDMPAPDRLAVLDDYLFARNAFHGSRTDYYNEANSHMDRVIDDREGLPIALSVLYMSLAKRLDLNVVGVGLPGHFVVRHEPTGGEAQLIDVFDRGKRLSREDAGILVATTSGRRVAASDFETSRPQEILVRMLINLHGLAQARRDTASMLRYCEAVVSIEPDSVQWRGMRAVLLHQEGRKRAALQDLDWILDKEPAGIDLDQIRRMREAFAQ
ncbi:MAG: tetratricopeptide repeat protein [Planctomycetales bacterium]|nr:tetratricopeptide repeat protein [Planctomycetales bacterium]